MGMKFTGQRNVASMTWQQTLERRSSLSREGALHALLDLWMEVNGLDKHPSELTDEEWVRFRSEAHERAILSIRR